MGILKSLIGKKKSEETDRQEKYFKEDFPPVVKKPASKKPEAKPASGWKCTCGATATGKFCPECGSPKPAEDGSWTCSCGAKNTGKFCAECGAKKPAGVPQYKCDKCGWQPADPTKAPKFCPECGDPFDNGDIV